MYGPGNGFDDENGHGTAVAGAVIHTAPWANIVNLKVEGATFYERASAVGDVIADHKQRRSDKVRKQKSMLTIPRRI
jgi:hypothetical protein